MQDAFAHCEAVLRAADKDCFLTTLFAPAEHRDALIALYAFNVEIARVREVVREPLAGEIRLQWWSDVLRGAGRGEIEANPVAAALLATIARYKLPLERFEALIAARRFDLYDDPMGALAGPTLARMERRDYDPFVPVAIAQWRRQWLIWRAARRPRRMFG